MKKYSEINEDFSYTEDSKKYIDKFWDKEKVVYYVGSPKSSLGDMGRADDLDRALELVVEYRQKWMKDACIFERKTRILSEEEINSFLNAKKYNL